MRSALRMTAMALLGVAMSTGVGFAAEGGAGPMSPPSTQATAPAFYLLTTANLEKAKTFYAGVLGLKVAVPQVHGSGLGVGLNSSGSLSGREPMILLQEAPKTANKGAIGPTSVYRGPLGFWVADVEAVLVRARAAGTTIVKPAYAEADGHLKALMIDPDGVLVEVLATK